jgi:hypothetical protein
VPRTINAPIRFANDDEDGWEHYDPRQFEDPDIVGESATAATAGRSIWHDPDIRSSYRSTIDAPSKSKCEVCLGDFGSKDCKQGPKITSSCRHPANYCLACLEEYIAVRIKDQTDENIECPGNGTGEDGDGELEYGCKEWLMDNEIRGWVSEELYAE